jgi:uncharacterized phiE125 gp8 family phage protein
MALLTLVTPAAPIVTLAEARKHCRVEGFTDDDAYLESLVAVATAHIGGKDGWLGRAIGTQTWSLKLCGFPSGILSLPLPPLQSVTSITYLDEGGVSQTYTGFRVFGVGGNGYILPAFEDVFPVALDAPESVTVTFVAGFAPTPVKHAVLLMVGHWYENREDASVAKISRMPLAVDALLMPYRNWGS